MKLLLRKILSNHNGEEGFALPQILLLALLLVTSLTALLSSSINRYSTTRFKTLEIQSKNASESGINTIKAFSIIVKKDLITIFGYQSLVLT